MLTLVNAAARTAAAQAHPERWPRGGLGIPGGILGVILALAVIALIVTAIVFLVRRMSTPAVAAAPPTGAATGISSARTVLDERFARGEIDEEEYSRRRTLLDGSR